MGFIIDLVDSSTATVCTAAVLSSCGAFCATKLFYLDFWWIISSPFFSSCLRRRRIFVLRCNTYCVFRWWGIFSRALYGKLVTCSCHSSFISYVTCLPVWCSSASSVSDAFWQLDRCVKWIFAGKQLRFVRNARKAEEKMAYKPVRNKSVQNEISWNIINVVVNGDDQRIHTTNRTYHISSRYVKRA